MIFKIKFYKIGCEQKEFDKSHQILQILQILMLVKDATLLQWPMEIMIIHSIILRQFRDTILDKSIPGGLFIKTYYIFSSMVEILKSQN
jgi:hypothetical protein